MKSQFRILDILGVVAIIVMTAGFVRTLYSLWKYTDNPSPRASQSSQLATS